MLSSSSVSLLRWHISSRTLQAHEFIKTNGIELGGLRTQIGNGPEIIEYDLKKKIDTVCHKCNNTWMSQFEQKNQPRFLNILQNEPFPLALIPQSATSWRRSMEPQAPTQACRPAFRSKVSRAVLFWMPFHILATSVMPAIRSLSHVDFPEAHRTSTTCAMIVAPAV
jgi:hypothetical protein